MPISSAEFDVRNCIDASFFCTFNSTDTLASPTVAVTTTLPFDMPLTKPFSSTTATSVSEDVQIAFCGAPSSSISAQASSSFNEFSSTDNTNPPSFSKNCAFFMIKSSEEQLSITNCFPFSSEIVALFDVIETSPISSKVAPSTPTISLAFTPISSSVNSDLLVDIFSKNFELAPFFETSVSKTPFTYSAFSLLQDELTLANKLIVALPSPVAFTTPF